MKMRSHWFFVRMALASLASGGLLLQTGCPVDVQGLVVRQATQVFTDSLFFAIESGLVRAL